MDYRCFKTIRSGIHVCKQFHRNIHKTTVLSINPKDVQEIRIPVPWGHIAGKWWGDSSKQPILAFHGWQDNAGTFDPLLELLPESFSVLAVDNPGHGFSSHFPKGMLYNMSNYIIMCRRIQNYYKWSKPLTILGHSQGASIGYMFSALYPEYVNALVMIDIIKPYPKTKKFQSQIGEHIDNAIINMTRTSDENKKYPLEEIEKRWIAGTRGSLTSEAVKVLMRRAVQLDSESGKYFLTRDPKVKILNLYYYDENLVLELASNMKCHLLVVKFTDGKFLDASLKNSPNYISTLEKSVKSFKLVTLEGTHHGHLNSPEPVASVITEFLKTHTS